MTQTVCIPADEASSDFLYSHSCCRMTEPAPFKLPFPRPHLLQHSDFFTLMRSNKSVKNSKRRINLTLTLDTNTAVASVSTYTLHEPSPVTMTDSPRDNLAMVCLSSFQSRFGIS